MTKISIRNTGLILTFDECSRCPFRQDIEQLSYGEALGYSECYCSILPNGEDYICNSYELDENVKPDNCPIIGVETE